MTAIASTTGALMAAAPGVVTAAGVSLAEELANLEQIPLTAQWASAFVGRDPRFLADQRDADPRIAALPRVPTGHYGVWGVEQAVDTKKLNWWIYGSFSTCFCVHPYMLLVPLGLLFHARRMGKKLDAGLEVLRAKVRDPEEIVQFFARHPDRIHTYLIDYIPERLRGMESELARKVDRLRVQMGNLTAQRNEIEKMTDVPAEDQRRGLREVDAAIEEVNVAIKALLKDVILIEAIRDQIAPLAARLTEIESKRDQRKRLAEIREAAAGTRVSAEAMQREAMAYEVELRTLFGEFLLITSSTLEHQVAAQVAEVELLELDALSAAQARLRARLEALQAKRLGEASVSGAVKVG